MRIETKSVKDLDPIEYKACYGANYGNGGYMRNTLSEARRGECEGFVIMLWTGPATTVTNMAGWCLVTPVGLKGETAATRYIKSKSKYTVQFWIKRPHRQKGLATLLMKEIKEKHDPRPHCFPHSEASGEFFSGYNISATKNERTWLRRGKPKVA